MNITILEDLKKELPKCRENKLRIRSIFNKYKNKPKYRYWSDIIFLNSIVIGLRELNLPYSIKEIYAAFSLVDENDYAIGEKKKALKFLTKGATSKSVFNGRE